LLISSQTLRRSAFSFERTSWPSSFSTASTRTSTSHEFPGRDHSLGLEADVDLNEIVVDREDLAARDLTFFEGSFATSKEFSETFAASGLLCCFTHVVGFCS
jgi:hypothetical protein